MKDERWMMNDERWTMNDEGWTMNHEWWTMNDERWTMNDEGWRMNDERWRMNDEWWMITAGRASWCVSVIFPIFPGTGANLIPVTPLERSGRWWHIALKLHHHQCLTQIRRPEMPKTAIGFGCQISDRFGLIWKKDISDRNLENWQFKSSRIWILATENKHTFLVLARWLKAWTLGITGPFWVRN